MIEVRQMRCDEDHLPINGDVRYCRPNFVHLKLVHSDDLFSSTLFSLIFLLVTQGNHMWNTHSEPMIRLLTTRTILIELKTNGLIMFLKINKTKFPV